MFDLSNIDLVSLGLTTDAEDIEEGGETAGSILGLRV